MGIPSRYFRAGVGAVIANADGLVLALERSIIPGAWQLPQGGWEAGESVETAVFREVEEETGLNRARLVLVDRYPEPLVYELPPEWQSTKTGLGQVQYWFLLKTRPGGERLVLSEQGEFRAWTWMPFDQLIQTTSSFRQALYRRLQSRFESRLFP